MLDQKYFLFPLPPAQLSKTWKHQTLVASYPLLIQTIIAQNHTLTFPLYFYVATKRSKRGGGGNHRWNTTKHQRFFTLKTKKKKKNSPLPHNQTTYSDHPDTFCQIKSNFYFSLPWNYHMHGKTPKFREIFQKYFKILVSIAMHLSKKGYKQKKKKEIRRNKRTKG